MLSHDSAGVHPKLRIAVKNRCLQHLRSTRKSIKTVLMDILRSWHKLSRLDIQDKMPSNPNSGVLQLPLTLIFLLTSRDRKLAPNVMQMGDAFSGQWSLCLEHRWFTHVREMNDPKDTLAFTFAFVLIRTVSKLFCIDAGMWIVVDKSS